MTTVMEQVNGTPQFTPLAPPPSRRAEKRADKEVEAEQRRLDEDAAHRRRLEEMQVSAGLKRQADNTKSKQKGKKRDERRERIAKAREAVAEHMPLPGVPVVAVSLYMGWTGQAEAARILGMGTAAYGVPVLTEGMTVTLAGLTSHAISKGRPHKGLLRATWITAIGAAVVNAGGHLAAAAHEAAKAGDTGLPMEGWYQAGAYALASLLAVVLWAIVMRQRHADATGQSAAEAARWRRVRRAHPILFRRARRIAAVRSIPMGEAWDRVWRSREGAAPNEPTIAEIRDSRRAAYERAVAESWDGRSEKDPAPPAPDERRERPHVEQPDMHAVEAPTLPTALLIPGDAGRWVEHRAPVLHPAAVRSSAPVPSARESAQTSTVRAGKPSRKGVARKTDDEPAARPATTTRKARRGRTRRTSLSDAELDAGVRELAAVQPDLSARYVAEKLGCDQGRAARALRRAGLAKTQSKEA